MTVDDSDPDDRREEPTDEHDDTVDEHTDDVDGTDDSVGGDESTDVPIDDSSSNGDSTARDDPATDEESTDRRSDERDASETRVGVSASGSNADSGSDAADESDGGNHWLSSLLSALESLDSGSTSGRRRTDRTVLDYDISIRSGDEVSDESRFDRERISGEGSDDRDRHSSRSRTRRRRSSSSDGLLTTRRYDDELFVTADVAGTDPDEVTVGFDGSSLVVAVSGSELDRVDVPWPDRSAEATIKNGVLTVQIEPDGRQDGAEGTEETDSSTEGDE